MKSDNELVCTLGAKEYAQYTIACAAPDPFVFSFGKAGSISFFKDGRVTSDLENADDAARNLLTLVEQYYREHILEAEHRAEQRARAEIGRALDKACETVMWIETPAMEGDNLAVTLCSHFEDCEGEVDDNGWHPKAVEGCDQVKSAIAQHFRSAIDAAREVG